MSKSVTKLQAFTAYVDMGDGRSIYGLFNQFKAGGYAIGRATLTRWRDQAEWDKRVPEVLAGREMEAQAAKVAVAARQLLEEAGVPPERPATDVLAVVPDDPDERPFEFTTHEKVESTLEALAAMTSALAVTVTRHVAKVADVDRVSMDLGELLSTAKVVGEVARATADLHKALNPPAAPIRTAQAHQAQGGHEVEGAAVPLDFDRLREGFRNPPRLRS